MTTASVTVMMHGDDVNVARRCVGIIFREISRLKDI